MTYTERPRLWSSEETADFLGISEKALRRRRERGTSPPYIQMGRSVRYAPGDVAKWLRANTVAADSPTPVQVIA